MLIGLLFITVVDTNTTSTYYLVLLFYTEKQSSVVHLQCFLSKVLQSRTFVNLVALEIYLNGTSTQNCEEFRISTISKQRKNVIQF